MLFHRDFRRYAGGHQKVFDYFRHGLNSGLLQPEIYFSAESLWDDSNPWCELSQYRVDHYDPSRFTAVFLAGMDWQAYLPLRSGTQQTVINLIQHVRHADPAADVYPFLSEKAIRICVSAEVEAAIVATGRVNGPVFTIANGIDTQLLSGLRQPQKSFQVYILGNKQPQLAQELAERLQGQGVALLVHSEHKERGEVLQAMAASEVTIALPHASEGFYLPALEAMALSEICIVPDCVGNRSFCQHGVNCLMPLLQLDALQASYWQARELLDSGVAQRYQQEALATLQRHSLDRERLAFFDILANLEQIW
jgi:hypothetical protein